MPARNSRRTASKAPAKTSEPQEATVTTLKQTRERVNLPSDIESEEVVWPGQSRNTNNAALREQLTQDVADMDEGSVRKYNISGNKEQLAFLNLFRSVAKNVHGETYSVQAVRQETAVIVRFVAKVTRQRKAKATEAQAEAV